MLRSMQKDRKERAHDQKPTKVMLNFLPELVWDQPVPLLVFCLYGVLVLRHDDIQRLGDAIVFIFASPRLSLVIRGCY